MALSHLTSSIVRDGLVVHLDAKNKKSYNGSGLIWYDMSGKSNNAILNGNINNPTWSNNGYWEFLASTTGLNGGMKILDSSSLRLSTMTVELIFTLETKTLGDTDWMCLFSKTISGNQAPAFSINQGTTNYRYLNTELPTSFNSSYNIFTDYTGDKWYHVIGTFSTSSFTYFNGSQISTYSGGITSTNSDIYLGLDYDNEMFKGKLAIVRVYNRALSYAEVLQNFYAVKERFQL